VPNGNGYNSRGEKIDIIGVGIDIVEVKRMERAINRKNNFLKHIYSEEELRLSERGKFRAQELAGRFAVKEAFFKAIKTGWRKGVRFQDVIVLNESSGAPYLILDGKTKEFAQSLGVKEIFVSISHVTELAVAVVIITK
jgi:holo-[acyl-carrier protein] synthase